MVERQIRARGIKNQRVLDAMLCVARHAFVRERDRERAYDDTPLPIGDGQTISQPYMVALMTETLDLGGEETVLEIGTGSGYQTAILAELASVVHTVERIPSLLFSARERLERLGYENVHFHEGDGTRGLPEHAPYDRILVTAGAPSLPSSLEEQLSERGFIVVPVGTRGVQMLTRYEGSPSGLRGKEICSCVFVPLIGLEGWSE